MVDLQTVIEELNTGKIEFDYKDDDCCTTEGEVVILLKRLAELETADVEEVKHGEWLQDWEHQRLMEDYDEIPYIKCSLCGQVVWNLDKERNTTPNYCENCGAKMDGGNAE